MSDTPLDRAVREAATLPSWQILLTCFGSQVKVTWTNSLHPEQVPIVFLEQAQQLLAKQLAARKQAGPGLIIPTNGGGAG